MPHSTEPAATASSEIVVKGKPISFEDLVALFEYPVKEAAKQLSISKTTLKKICEDFKIERWPQRKVCTFYRSINFLQVKALKAKLLSLETMLLEGTEESRTELLQERIRVQEELGKLYIDPRQAQTASHKKKAVKWKIVSFDANPTVVSEQQNNKPNKMRQSLSPEPTQYVENMYTNTSSNPLYKMSINFICS